MKNNLIASKPQIDTNSSRSPTGATPTHSDSEKPAFLRVYFVAARTQGKKPGFKGPHAATTNKIRILQFSNLQAPISNLQLSDYD